MAKMNLFGALAIGMIISLSLALLPAGSAFNVVSRPTLSTHTSAIRSSQRAGKWSLCNTETNDEIESTSATATTNGVVELSDEEEKKSDAGPQGPLFISQGELDPQALNPDFSDGKQTRVLIYTILSLLPVLFLIPFMLSREFIPQDVMPPVDMM